MSKGYIKYKITIEGTNGMGRPSKRYYSVLSNEGIDIFKGNVVHIMKVYNYRIINCGTKKVYKKQYLED